MDPKFIFYLVALQVFIMLTQGSYIRDEYDGGDDDPEQLVRLEREIEREMIEEKEKEHKNKQKGHKSQPPTHPQKPTHHSKKKIEETFGDKTEEDMRELETFYKKAKESIISLHKKRAEFQNDI